MANAKLCDRCGKFYVPNDDVWYPILRTYTRCLIEVELCEDCRKELIAFLCNGQDDEKLFKQKELHIKNQADRSSEKK